MPAVSVIIPVYNAAGYLAAALPRLLQQSFDDFEIIIVDDCSTDDSVAVAEAFAAGRTNIRIIRQPVNTGVARARERGVQESAGTHIWFVDSDDDWSDDALAVLYGAAIASGVDVLVAAAAIIGADGAVRRTLAPPPNEPVSGLAAFRLLLTGKLTGHLWNKLFTRTLLRSIEYVPARVHSDLAMVADALSRADRVGFDSTVIYDYRLRDGGSIITSGSSRADSLDMVGAAVGRAADRLQPGLTTSDEYRYFRSRYILLSGIKDGVLGPYSSAESARIVAKLRSRLSAGELMIFAKKRDARRLLLGVAAKTSVPAYRALLAVADR